MIETPPIVSEALQAKSALSATAKATAQDDATDEFTLLFTKKLWCVLIPVKLKKHPSAVDPYAKSQMRLTLAPTYLTHAVWTSVVTDMALQCKMKNRYR